MAMFALLSFLLLFLASKMISWELMYQAFGFKLMPSYAGLFLLAVLWEPLGFFLSPLAMALSRRFERDADAYGVERLHHAGDLIRALKKMAKENLANLNPHPLYVHFNYSHPPMIERIRFLSGLQEQT
jgi:STE24 endopeptidase